jgi:hypothetical protein
MIYALDLAGKRLEQGFTSLQLSTEDSGYTVENGSVSTKQVELNCGVKGETSPLSISDTPDHVPTSLAVEEWLRSK